MRKPKKKNYEKEKRARRNNLGVIFMPKRDKALKGARPVTLMTMDQVTESDTLRNGKELLDHEENEFTVFCGIRRKRCWN